MRTRRKAREAALQIMYQCDTLEDWSDTTIALYFEVFQKPEGETSSDADIANSAFCHAIIQGVIKHRDEIDKAIQNASLHWPLPRMSRVDRNILRLACFELGFTAEVPVNVCLNEAVELAKSFGADESPNFINGILDKLSKVLESEAAFPALQQRRKTGTLAA